MSTYGGGPAARKVVLVGNSGVGKTALVLRFVQDTWTDGDYPSTIGRILVVHVCGHACKHWCLDSVSVHSFVRALVCT